MAEQAPIPGERVLRIAAISDIHRGNPDTRYPQRNELRSELVFANKAGADLLILGGDLGDRGSIEGMREVGEDAAESFPGIKIAVAGNHDTDEGMEELRQCGIDVLEKQRRILRINGLKIGLYGQGGFLDHAIRERMRDWDWDAQAPVHHEYTRRNYHPHAVEQISALVQEGVDVLIAVSHVGLYRQHVSNSPQQRLTEMTPDIGEFIDSQEVGLRLALSGHHHSFGRYGPDEPLVVTENNTFVGSIAAPNARRNKRSVVTMIDVYRLPDGSLTAQYVPLPSVDISQAS